MYFDRFDICEAHYLFLSNYHEGQWSYKYWRLSYTILTRLKFKPHPNLSVETISANAKEIYEALCQREADGTYPKADHGDRRVTGTQAGVVQRPDHREGV